MTNMEQLKLAFQKEPDAFCVSWIQRRLLLGYANACALRDEALHLGLVVRVDRVTAHGQKEFAYVHPGSEPIEEQVWISVAESASVL